MNETAKPYVCRVEEASEEDIVVTSTYNILFTNDLTCSRITEFLYYVKQSPQYKQSVKQETKRLETLTRAYERKITEVASVRCSFMSDANQAIEDELQTDIQRLQYAFEHEFLKSKCSNAHLMALTEIARTFAMFACLNLDHRIQEMTGKGIYHATGLKYLRLTEIYKSIDRLVDLLFEGGKVNLNGSLNCRNGMRIIEKKLADAHLIAKALEEAESLNPT